MESGKGLKMLNKLICLIKGHSLKMAGECPFTKKTYNFCERCHKMFPING